MKMHFALHLKYSLLLRYFRCCSWNMKLLVFQSFSSHIDWCPNKKLWKKWNSRDEKLKNMKRRQRERESKRASYYSADFLNWKRLSSICIGFGWHGNSSKNFLCKQRMRAMEKKLFAFFSYGNRCWRLIVKLAQIWTNMNFARTAQMLSDDDDSCNIRCVNVKCKMKHK